MTYIYQATDGKKLFYFISNKKDSIKALQDYGVAYGKDETGEIIEYDLYESFDDFYRIFLAWSHPDKNIACEQIMRNMIISNLQPLGVMLPHPRC